MYGDEGGLVRRGAGGKERGKLTARIYHLSSPSVLAGNFSSIALKSARASSAVGSRGTFVSLVVILISYIQSCFTKNPL